MGKVPTILVAVAALLLSAAPVADARARAHNRPGGPRARAASPAPRDAPAIQCDLFASPAGSDAAGDGSLIAPFASVNKLDAALSPGQTGCLRAGSYGGTRSWHRIDSDGSPTGRVTITSFPGETAIVRGYVDVEGSYTTLSHLSIDGSNTFYDKHPAGVDCPAPTSQALTIAGRNDVLEYDDYYQSVASLRGTGIGVGFWGDADNAIIRYDKIHDVGQCQGYDHLIYLSHGNNVRIYDNWLWNDAHGRGVQLYPAPTNAKVFDNVIDHVGEGFVIGNESGDTVSGNRIYNNIITNTTGLRSENIPGEAIHDLYGGRPGTGNAFFNNVLYRNPGGVGRLTSVRAFGNRTALNPEFVDATRHDYDLRRNSPLLVAH
jgi:hypothetical protein